MSTSLKNLYDPHMTLVSLSGRKTVDKTASLGIYDSTGRFKVLSFVDASPDFGYSCISQICNELSCLPLSNQPASKLE